mgnify:CR=1 FL=1
MYINSVLPPKKGDNTVRGKNTVWETILLLPVLGV